MPANISGFLPWRKAFIAAGVDDMPITPRGYWGHQSGLHGLVVSSVWDDRIQLGEAKAFVPIVNRGGYRKAAEKLSTGSEVIVILRSRSTELGKVMPTRWKVESRHLDEASGDSIGYLLLTNTGREL
jgi:hypothetical protein